MYDVIAKNSDDIKDLCVEKIGRVLCVYGRHAMLQYSGFEGDNNIDRFIEPSDKKSDVIA